MSVTEGVSKATGVVRKAVKRMAERTFKKDVVDYLVQYSRPNCVAKNITELNFQKMKDMGYEKLIFDKYNSLLKGGEVKFHQ